MEASPAGDSGHSEETVSEHRPKGMREQPDRGESEIPPSQGPGLSPSNPGQSLLSPEGPTKLLLSCPFRYLHSQNKTLAGFVLFSSISSIKPLDY